MDPSLRPCPGYGCGYGRGLDQLFAAGYRNALGVDAFGGMIARGRRCFPHLDLRQIGSLPIDEPDRSFDAVLLIAVLTCIPGDDAQMCLMAELHRLLHPGGMLYLSDMPLQSDARNLERYTTGEARFGTYGVFETDDGAIVRHHFCERFDTLLYGFDRLIMNGVQVSTMNGHVAEATQLMARRRSC